jgi:lipopolysaccharide transport system permease protein
MRNFSLTPVEMFASLWRHRELIKALTIRELLGRYRGSFLGLLWSFFNPLFMLAILTFVFSVVFQARWGDASSSKTEFALLLYIGLIVFNLFADSITRAPTLILSNVNYVKKVVFPLEILPIVNFLLALIHALISLVVWLIAYMVFFGEPHYTIFLLPFMLLPFCLFIIGLSWVLASLGVYLRDISQFIGILTTALLFLSPIFYPITAIPEDYRYLVYFNPISIVVDESRNLLFWGETTNFFVLGFYWIVCFCIAWLGFLWFQKSRKGFADVL